MSRTAFGQELARRLYSTEHALDQALSEAAQLVASMTTGRVDNRISAVVGQDALENILAAMSTVGAARAAVVAAHHQMKADADRMRIDWRLAGPEAKPEDDRPIRTIARLSAVA
ncbi:MULTISPECIES: hypothetical protein [unclassified Brevundimonas]|uniref:hypothetical protein n=1 Tax=unclassified Brevundimonas TaxID=2622653 RepID=UPI000CFB43E3|nr:MULTISPECIES: hypothetical protein [unclassified Brevundimonas]PRA27634.1 hypothetical protein CQ024_11125 [Brevundimonas sp. MYb27]PQZ84413.1 hypothetical protein CQ026_01010 [Brevundimonas sp. MYb31]PRB17646.1 hypothetical protein CQ039_01005 [Brevundimonas sp. MYb52]PRB38019.1 hypothetical protein CQ035_01010 [Brevundimonas sp. MYb46]PRB41991.1 hypothetical protein CQ028_15120 [Brevundimonas sp. MYb33]